MSPRILLIALALLLGVVGIILSRPRDPEPAPPRKVAVARQDIPTYTMITPDMIEEKTLPADQARNAPVVDDVVGRMTTRNVTKGATLTDLSALSPEQVRFISDLSLEVISFPARFDEVVGGQLKPGHKINVYAYRGVRNGETYGNRTPEVRLIASDIPVVDVRTRAGDSSGRLQPTPTAAAARSGGLFGSANESSARLDPGSIVTVAVPPEMAYLIVDTMGAQGFDAWVTLAGNRAAQIPATVTPTALPPTATPRPTNTVAPPVTPQPTPNIQATIEAILKLTPVANQQPVSPPPSGPLRGNNIPTTGGQKP